MHTLHSHRQIRVVSSWIDQTNDRTRWQQSKQQTHTQTHTNKYREWYTHVVKLGVYCAKLHRESPTRDQIELKRNERWKENNNKYRVSTNKNEENISSTAPAIERDRIHIAYSRVRTHTNVHIWPPVNVSNSSDKSLLAKLMKWALWIRVHIHAAYTDTHIVGSLKRDGNSLPMLKGDARSLQRQHIHSCLPSILSIWVQLQMILKFHSILNAALSCEWCLEVAPLQ